MTDADALNARTEFAQIWHMLTLAWPNTTHPKGRSRLYAEALRAFDPAEIAAVAQELILLGGEFFPSPSMLYLRLLERRDGAPDWATAWAEAVENASAREPVWSHPAVQEASRAVGGNWHIRNSTNVPATRAQYRDAYETILTRRRQDYASGRQALPPPRHTAGQLPAAARMLEAARG